MDVPRRRGCPAWIVDPFQQMVEVFRKDGNWTEYGADQTAKLRLDGAEYDVPVAATFG